ncbi:hypothetical protein MPTK1_5g18110 [Marchantia polymorpha subsp. ruderalis]|uniref:Uncharacterized protein n=2 Tax=Marchantia polymorpha TaxID=3197 RepID=A0AAF6BJK9_MARPO|nr:hypothetical protein MARPO_0084s0058 [Marchantia polymorpha]BBN12193.1 hypothetical protein Mp_5g18110 [Marchantia polymorpha subsp. ruderalis]|eukprot:PTQ33979.1 hypothetical protein MARPO_0084s0058 [Marchantia polymorpha]
MLNEKNGESYLMLHCCCRLGVHHEYAIWQRHGRSRAGPLENQFPGHPGSRVYCYDCRDRANGTQNAREPLSCLRLMNFCSSPSFHSQSNPGRHLVRACRVSSVPYPARLPPLALPPSQGQQHDSYGSRSKVGQTSSPDHRTHRATSSQCIRGSSTTPCTAP